MNIEFDPKEILYIYGHLGNKAKEFENMKNTSFYPGNKKNLNYEIKMISAILQKLEAAYPPLLCLKSL